MNQTQNLHLPQWEAEDRILRTDFNDAMAAIDAAVPRIVTGTYTGDGAATRTIPLDFTPKILYVCRNDGAGTYNGNEFHGGLAMTGYPSCHNSKNFLEITENGFIVGLDTTRKTNTSGTTYYYVALF